MGPIGASVGLGGGLYRSLWGWENPIRSLWGWGGCYGSGGVPMGLGGVPMGLSRARGVAMGLGGSLWGWGGPYGSRGCRRPPHAPEKHSVNSCSSLVARSRAFRACSSVTRLLISLEGDGGRQAPPTGTKPRPPSSNHAHLSLSPAPLSISPSPLTTGAALHRQAPPICPKPRPTT